MHTKTILAVAVATFLVQAQAAPPQAVNAVASANSRVQAKPQDTTADDEFDLSNNTNYEEADDKATVASIVKMTGVEDPEKEEDPEKLEDPENEDLAGEVNEASGGKKVNKASNKKGNEASDKKVHKAHHHMEEEDEDDAHAAESNKSKGMARPATAKLAGNSPKTDEDKEEGEDKGSKKVAADEEKDVEEETEGADDSEKAEDTEATEDAEGAEKKEEEEVSEPASAGEEKDLEEEGVEEEGVEEEAEDNTFEAAENIPKSKGSASVSLRASASSQAAVPSGLSLSFSGGPSGLARPSTAAAARPSASAGSAKIAKSNGNLVRVSVGATVGAVLFAAFSLL